MRTVPSGQVKFVPNKWKVPGIIINRAFEDKSIAELNEMATVIIASHPFPDLH